MCNLGEYIRLIHTHVTILKYFNTNILNSTKCYLYIHALCHTKRYFSLLISRATSSSQDTTFLAINPLPKAKNIHILDISKYTYSL